MDTKTASNEWLMDNLVKLELDRRNNLTQLKEENQKFNKKKKKRKKSQSKCSSSRTTLLKYKKAYNKWEDETSNYPRVPVQHLLILIRLLSEESVTDVKPELKECIENQSTNFDVPWESPSCLLKALRLCILTRDWNRMVYLAIILINMHKRYIPFIRNYCRVMAKFNPLVKDCELEEQFKLLTEGLAVV